MTKKASQPSLRRPEDASAVLFSATVWLCYAAAFFCLLNPGWAGLETFPRKMAFVVGVGFFLGLVGGANAAFNLHNHFHQPVFRSERRNLWFGRLTALSAGWSWLLWMHVHREHHALLATDRDWTTPRRKPDGRPEGLVGFVLFRSHWRIFVNLKRDYESGHITGSTNVAKELRLFAVLWATPFLLGPWAGLGLWLFPHVVANFFVLATMAYVNHVGARRVSEPSFTLANSFDSPLFNRLSFNAGLAAAHHAHPDVHWSILPTVHAEEHERMIDQGTHVLPYGPYSTLEVLGVLDRKGEAHEEFDRTQARDFGTPLCLRAEPAETVELAPQVRKTEEVSTTKPAPEKIRKSDSPQKAA